MARHSNQGLWAPGGATVHLSLPIYLAPPQRERLWKGLERFVNCGDSLEDYQALGRGWPHFWPVEVWHYPKKKPPAHPSTGAAPEPKLSKEELREKLARETEMEYLSWYPSCHRLFLCYRDMLRRLWQCAKQTDTRYFSRHWISPEFLLGLTDYNHEALRGKTYWPPLSGASSELHSAWEQILKEFPTVAVEGPVRVGMLWGHGDFLFVPHGDFQRAFYLLFRQSWRARVCPRCKRFFVARKPKQTFCGTVCSAGSRLASKRKWWRAVGAKRRAHKHLRRGGRRITTRNRIERRKTR